MCLLWGTTCALHCTLCACQSTLWLSSDLCAHEPLRQVTVWAQQQPWTRAGSRFGSHAQWRAAVEQRMQRPGGQPSQLAALLHTLLAKHVSPPRLQLLNKSSVLSTARRSARLPGCLNGQYCSAA